jgi:predicted metal-dependent hydrolase
MRQLKKERRTININGQAVALTIERAQQRSSTLRMKPDGLLVRLPAGMVAEAEAEVLQILLDKLMHKNPTLPTLAEAARNAYKDGNTLQVGARTYTLYIDTAERDSSTARLMPPNGIQLTLNQDLDEAAQQRAVRTLLSRVVAADCLPAFSRRVFEYNHLFFRKEIKGIRFKNNQSNWGSCSNKANLNFSTRLLFAPEAVQDYVIIHELAHLVELNHSDRFWALVEQAMPDYLEKEKWLKENGGQLGF